MKMKSNSYEIEMVCMTHTGHIRVHNEDNISFDGFYLPEEHQSMGEPMLCRLKGGSCGKAAVFDGMGGESRGELASYTAAKMLTEEMEEDRWTRGKLFQMVESLNHEVCRVGEELKIGRMGTTAAILAMNPGEIWACNVGDSPIYLYRNGQLKML
mgnify:CR=1 FL=1